MPIGSYRDFCWADRGDSEAFHVLGTMFVQCQVVESLFATQQLNYFQSNGLGLVVFFGVQVFQKGQAHPAACNSAFVRLNISTFPRACYILSCNRQENQCKAARVHRQLPASCASRASAAALGEMLVEVRFNSWREKRPEGRRVCVVFCNGQSIA